MSEGVDTGCLLRVSADGEPLPAVPLARVRAAVTPVKCSARL